MKRLLLSIHIILAAAILTATASAASSTGITRNIDFHRAGPDMRVAMELVLDSLHLGADHQIYVTPVINGGTADSTQRVALPTVLINGRNMHYAYERGSLRREIVDSYNLSAEIWRHNGRPQQHPYAEATPVRRWMYGPKAFLSIVYDTCGCGVPAGREIVKIPLGLTPVMRHAYLTPEVTELPVAIHEGKARVQFEVDRTELHPEPYKCRNGQRIDNREQLAVIYDSIRYATSDPNVEIARIDICGYASPESPYSHNDYLATNRSRALAEYIGERFSLPAEKCTYSAVPENWGEFREMVVASPELTDRQRADLLELIDAPAYGPADYDAKERTLKTDPRFARLYRDMILPKWFPRLRATKFAISTRLKPMSDEQLARIIDTDPEMMSLNQMFRVARLYPEGSPEFNRVIGIALEHYPDSPVANLNAAVAAIAAADYDRAASLLDRAGDSPQAENARGVVAVRRGDFDSARTHFLNAADRLPEAAKNLEELPQ